MGGYKREEGHKSLCPPRGQNKEASYGRKLWVSLYERGDIEVYARENT